MPWIQKGIDIDGEAQFNYSDTYEQEVKDVLNYDETMFNLNNIKIR